MADLSNRKCIPCNKFIPPLKIKEINGYMADISPNWRLEKHKGIYSINRQIRFIADDTKCLKLITEIGKVAVKEGHHPKIEWFWDMVNIQLYTFAIKGLHLNDFIIAAKIDKILAKLQKK